MNLLRDFFRVLSILLEKYSRWRNKQEGRKEAFEEVEQKSKEAQEKADEVNKKPTPKSKSDILDRM